MSSSPLGTTLGSYYTNRMPLDIGVGLLLGLLVDVLFNTQDAQTVAVVGALMCLAPDLDFIIQRLLPVHRRRMEHHRELLHIPLIYVPVGAAIGWLVAPHWAVLFVLASLAHFVHDSIGIGWGVPWLYPFRCDSYSFFYHIENANGKPTLPRRRLYVWRRQELSKLAATYGDEHWVRNIYGRLHPYAIIEFVVLVVGLVVFAAVA